MKPLVSVVITSYNYAHFIRTAIDSVLAQDYENFEIIVTDNCSTDDTQKVLGTYSDDARVRVNVNPVNIGITPNINEGIKRARGEYVVILSADDWLLAGHLSRLTAIAQEHPDVGFVYSTAYLCGNDQAPTAVRLVLGQTLVPYTGGREELGWLLSACYMCLPTILFRRSLFERYGYLDESFEVASDWEITVRMIVAGEKTAYVPAPLVGVRIHENQASGVSKYVVSGADLREHLEIFERYYDRAIFDRAHGRELRAISSLRFRRDMLRQAAPQNLTEELDVRTDRAIFALGKGNRKRSSRKPPKVAVIVTSTGRVNSLAGCLESLARQTYPSWEVWVLQDFGFDVSGVAAQKIPRNHFHFSRSFDRLGVAVMRTQGLIRAHGDYYLFLDEDTQILPDHIERLVTAAEAGDGVAIAGTIVQFNQVDGTMGWHPLGNTDGTYPLRPSANDLLIANCVPLSAVLFDIAAADGLENFDANYAVCSDWEFIIRLSRLRQLAYTGTRSLVEHAFLGLNGQLLSWQWGVYLDRLQAIYAAYGTTNAEILQGRERHRANVAGVIGRGPAACGDVQSLFTLYNVLSGSGASVASTAGVPA